MPSLTQYRCYNDDGRTQFHGSAAKILDNGKPYRLTIHRVRNRHVGDDEHYPHRTVHTHDHYHLVLYTSGRNELIVGDERHVARKGTLFFGSPLDPYLFVPLIRNRTTFVVVTFGYHHHSHLLRLPVHNLLERICGQQLRDVPYPQQLGAESSARLAESMQHLLNTLLDTAAPRRMLDATALFLQLIFDVAGAIYLSENEAAAPTHDGLARVRTHIDRAFREKLDLDTLAEIACLSKGYLVTAFKHEYGRTPIDYQMAKRLEAAKHLLLATGLRTREIAQQVGYPNEYYFSRVFKRKVGRTATAFRQEFQSD